MIEARLSRNGAYVLCGMTLPNGEHCPERLGFVLREVSQEHPALWPLPGFVRDDESGTWRLGTRATERLRQDRAAAAAGDTGAQRRLRLAIAARGRRLPWEPRIAGAWPVASPQVDHALRQMPVAPPALAWAMKGPGTQPELRDGDRIRCPRCGGINVITSGVAGGDHRTV